MSFTFGTSGTSSSSTAAPTSIFGQNAGAQPAAGGSNIFGNLKKSSTTPSLFGNTSSTAAAGPTPSLFGSKPPATSGSSTPSLFAPKTDATSGASTPSIFGNTSTTPSSGVPGTSGSTLFGQQTSSTSSGSTLFGNTSSTANNSSLFPSTTTAAASNALQTPAKPFSSFQSTTPSGAPPTNVAKPFGSFNLGGASTTPAATSAPASSTPSLFAGLGTTSQPASSTSTTAAASPFTLGGATAPKTSLFSGTASTGNAAGSSPFSNLLNPATSQPATSTPAATTPSLFGSTPATTAAAPAASTPSLFGSAQAGGAAKTPSLFAPPATSTTTAASTTPSLFAPASAATPAASGASTPSLFGSKPVATTASAAPATSTPSLFGATTSATAPAATTAATPSLFGGAATTSAAAPAATTAASTPSLFGGAAASSAAPASTAATTSSATPAFSLGAASTSATADKPAAPATNLAASTAGPQSSLPRLKNKTMDEIITRWATDLSKYQKEFKEQATKVASWDRLLVENGEKIQKLYSAAYEADRQSNEIERQLLTIEGNQEELEAWLKRYEDEVSELYSKQVGGIDSLSGPDQERERTYKMAENLNDRMDEMGKDLGSMIKEINDVSGSINKAGKPDDPLSQIVRVLNGHLTQLQWIDTNAAALTAKVNAAQKASHSIGHHHRDPESDAADGFYRSYTGRR